MTDDPTLLEMHAITLAQKMTQIFHAPMDRELMVVFVPIMRRMMRSEATADEVVQGCLDAVPRRFVDMTEEGS